MSWSNEKLEALFLEMQKRSLVDAEFRKKLLADSGAALEELAGEKLPDGFKVKILENDPEYTATFVLPDLLSEELGADELDAATGGAEDDEPVLGLGVALIVSVCGAAVQTLSCAGDVCGAAVCAADVVCIGDVCGAKGSTL